MWTVGNLRTNDPHRLLLQGVQDQSFFVVVSFGEGNKAGTEAPDKLFLGGTVQFDGEDTRMQVGKFTKERFLHGVFVKKTKVSIIGDDDNIAATLRDIENGRDNGIPFGDSGCVAAGVIGEVEDNNRFPLLLRRCLAERHERRRHHNHRPG